MADMKATPVGDRVIRRNFISECRDNRIVVQTELSPAIRQLYRRHFDGFSRSVYLLRFYARTSRLTDIETVLTQDIINQMDQATDNLHKKLQVAEQLLANNRITPSHAQFEKLHVSIIDPLANRYLQVIILAQALHSKLSALWLACILNDQQQRSAVKEIRNELRAIHTHSRAISLGLMHRIKSQQVSSSENDAPDDAEAVADSATETMTPPPDAELQSNTSVKTLQTEVDNTEEFAGTELELEASVS
jgi:hypothetical protein